MVTGGVGDVHVEGGHETILPVGFLLHIDVVLREGHATLGQVDRLQVARTVEGEVSTLVDQSVFSEREVYWEGVI